MFTLPNLSYAYDALEPHIDAETMTIHHDKHHQAYMDKLNVALEGHNGYFEMTIEDILSDLETIPDEFRTAVQNNGGGYYHHSIFWQMMSPNGGGEPTGDIAKAINTTFESFESFKKKFTKEASIHFASGWTWLVKDESGDLSIMSTSNQDSPISNGLTPLLGIDTWEHSYYLKYQNRRPEYINSWWNVVNWEYVNEALTK